MASLEPLEPTDALELYLQEKRGEVSQATHYGGSSWLGHFVRWCSKQKYNGVSECVT